MTAGQASRSKVTINPVFLKQNTEEVIEDTIPHEVAHLVVQHLMGAGWGHSPKWIDISKQLGCNGDRCHSMDITASLELTGGAFNYSCDCKKHVFSKRRHNGVQLRGNRYTCRYCRKLIKWDK